MSDIEADFPRPNLEIQAHGRHHWIAEVEGADSYDEFPPMERLTPRRSS